MSETNPATRILSGRDPAHTPIELQYAKVLREEEEMEAIRKRIRLGPTARMGYIWALTRGQRGLD